MDPFPKALAKQSLWVTPGLHRAPHRTHTPAAPWKPLGITSPGCDSAWSWACQGTGPSPWAGNTSGRQTHRLCCCSHWKVSAQDTCTKHTELLLLAVAPERGVSLYINPEIKWIKIEPGGLEQLRQWMNVPSALNSAHLPTDKAIGEAETRKENSWDRDRF